MKNLLARYRPDPLMSVVCAAVASAFISGAGIGVLASMPTTAQPAQVIPCNSAPDVIACLIEEAEEEEEEPPHL